MPEFENLQRQQQQQPIQIQHEPIRAHLTTLQNWDGAEGQILEERRRQHANTVTQYQLNDFLLQQRAQEQLQPVQADRAAPGQPEQVQAPARLTYKQRREQERRLKEAKKANPAADLDSYNAVHALKHYAAVQNNSMNTPGIIQQAEANRVDKRVLRCFCNGYQTDKKGRTLTQEDAAKKQADERFLSDYVSANLERRKPHLNRMVNQLLSANITEDMFTDDYLTQHTAEMKQLVDKMVYFQNVYSDPVNKPYFDAMDPITKTLIETRILARYAVVGQAFITLLGAKAVLADHATYVDGDVSQHAGFAQPIRDILHQTLEETAQKEQDEIHAILREKMEVYRQEEMDNSNFVKAKKEEEQLGEEGLNLTTYALGYSYENLSKARQMIETHPDTYAAHRDTVDALYQQLYRTVDSFGDNKLEAQMVQNVILDYMNPRTIGEKVMQMTSSNLQDKLRDQSELLKNEISELHDALKHFLRGDELTGGAARLLERMGLNQNNAPNDNPENNQ